MGLCLYVNDSIENKGQSPSRNLAKLESWKLTLKNLQPPLMAQEFPQHQEPVLLLGPPKSALTRFFPKLLTNFTFLTPFDFPPTPLPEFLISHAQSIRVLFCISGGGSIPITSELLSCIPNLECIVNAGVGLDHVDLGECKRKGIRITNAGGAFTEDVADCAVALLIDVLRRVSVADRYVRARGWATKGDYPLARKVGGKRVGIIGLGSIGSEVAKRLTAFGCIIAYNSRKKKDSVSFPFYSNVTDLATNSDVLILCCALTDKTYHMIDKNVLSALGTEGIIVNIGRGALIDEKELVHSLVNGEIGGAGLDFYENEPNVPKELFELDNVVLSPHCAVVTPESFSALQDLCVANLEAFLSKKPLLSPVSYE